MAVIDLRGTPSAEQQQMMLMAQFFANMGANQRDEAAMKQKNEVQAEEDRKEQLRQLIKYAVESGQFDMAERMAPDAGMPAGFFGEMGSRAQQEMAAKANADRMAMEASDRMLMGLTNPTSPAVFGTETQQSSGIPGFMPSRQNVWETETGIDPAQAEVIALDEERIARRAQELAPRVWKRSRGNLQMTRINAERPIIAIVGGTGKEGKGLAYRWAKAGYSIIIGSRAADKAAAAASDLEQLLSLQGRIMGASNSDAASQADIVMLTVPYAAHAEILESIKQAARGKLLIDATVPLQAGKPTKVQMPPAGSAAQEARGILGNDVEVTAAFHTILAEDLVRFLLRDAAPPGVLEDHHAGALAEGGVGDFVGVVAHAFPVARRLRGVAAGDPFRGAPVPVRGRRGLTRRLVVVREQGGVLVEVAARPFEGARNRGMQCTSPLAEQRVRGDRLCEWVLEAVLGDRVERLLVQESPLRRRASASASSRSGRPATAASSGSAMSLPITAAAWSTRFSRSGRRSIRAASRACTVAGTSRRARGSRRR